jgi:hypothetical protein
MPPGCATIMLGLLLLMGCFTPTPLLAGASLPTPTAKCETNPAPESSGPTLHLDGGRGESAGNPVAEFMYFVPLISLEPVSVVISPGNTQRARMVSAKRSFTAKSFLTTCEFEFVGEGNQQSIFDHAEKVRRHEREIKEGGSLDHQLGSINVEGAGGVCRRQSGGGSGHCERREGKDRRTGGVFETRSGGAGRRSRCRGLALKPDPVSLSPSRASTFWCFYAKTPKRQNVKTSKRHTLR